MTSKYYHFIGIGGIGMGTLASLLLDKGHKISGSDLKESEWTRRLGQRGAQIFLGHHPSHLTNPDFVVYSSAVRSSNVELLQAAKAKIPMLRRAEILASLVNEKQGITVAGAHGKTTTTSMVSSLLIHAGFSPTTAVGGIINGASYNAHLGDGKYFVAEVDESDGTFLYFHPRYSIITNIDYEHVDFYKDWQGIMGAYARFINGLARGGRVIACGEDVRLLELIRKARVPGVMYGLSPQRDVYAASIEMDGFHSSFECFCARGALGCFKLQVPGLHNVLNALACISLGLELEIPYTVMRKALESFTGVKRRFQLKGQVDDVMVVDDYGHHPAEIKATLKAARLFGKKRLMTVFQPHRYSRTKFLLSEMVESLQLTDQLILTDIYAAGEDISEGIGTSALLEKLQGTLGPRVVFLKKEDILKHLQTVVSSGDLVLFLGAGDIDHLSGTFVTMLKCQYSAQHVYISSPVEGEA